MSTNANNPSSQSPASNGITPNDAPPPAVPSDPAAAKAAREAKRAARAAARAAAQEQRRQAALQELEAIECVQERIDRVAADLQRRRKRYKDLTADELMELLEVNDPSGGGDEWRVLHLRRIHQLEDAGCLYPFAEHVDLLKLKVAPDRFRELSDQAERILKKLRGPDLKLTAEEEAALRREYPKHHKDECGLDLVITSLQASNGDELCFEGVIGDAGDVEQLWSPYERGFDTTNYEQVD